MERDLQDWPDEIKIQLLVKASDCLFIYAATVCCFVRNPNWSLEKRLDLILQSDARGDQLIAKLNKMYTQILRCCITAKQDEEERIKLNKQFKKIIRTIVFLFNVFFASALTNLLSIPTKEVEISLKSLRFLLNILKDLNLSIWFFHPSFRDFLLNVKRCHDSHF